MLGIVIILLYFVGSTVMFTIFWANQLCTLNDGLTPSFRIKIKNPSKWTRPMHQNEGNGVSLCWVLVINPCCSPFCFQTVSLINGLLFWESSEWVKSFIDPGFYLICKICKKCHSCVLFVFLFFLEVILCLFVLSLLCPWHWLDSVTSYKLQCQMFCLTSWWRGQHSGSGQGVSVRSLHVLGFLQSQFKDM